MEMSESIKDLAAALAKAQGTMRHAAKDSVNPHFKSRYADLAGVIDAAREPLSANGLSFIQELGGDGKTLTCRTILMHASGQWMASTLTIIPGKPDAQGIGSAATYARRYSLSAVLGIASEDDDDGNAASRQPSAPQREVAPDPARPQSSTAKKMFSEALANWTGLTGTDLAAAAREVAAAHGVKLDAANDANFARLTESVNDLFVNEIKFVEWSAKNKNQSAKVKG